VTSTTVQGPAGPSLSPLARRLREPPFWRIQAMVLLITAAHVLLESHLLPIEVLDHLPSPFQHVPVVLYVVPVTYAGFIYGFEGGVLTGLWCALLASVNIMFWHRSDFEWITELVFILVVVGMGVVMSVPVERERRQRKQAEATNRQLRMLNDVVQASLRPWGTEKSAHSALVRLVAVLDIRGACLTLWKRDGDEAVVSAIHATDRSLETELEAWLHEVQPGDDGTSGQLRADFREVALATESLRGALWVNLSPGQELTTGQQDFLQAVGSQLAVGIENAMLHQQERELLESYVRLVTQAQEEERKHIARELHDGAAQQLAILCRGLDEVAEPEAPAKSTELARLRHLATSTLDEIRQFSRDLRPTLLDDLGLVPALEWLVADIANRTPTQAELTVEGSIRRLPPEVEVALYRITQEALRNVDRHSGSTRVGVNVRFEPERIVVSVEDDGSGFQVPSNFGTLVSTGKLGLLGMQERAQLTGGSFALESHPGTGTLVTIDIPA
jgi:signal transduction histidine kinase